MHESTISTKSGPATCTVEGKELVHIKSLGIELCGYFIPAVNKAKAPALIVSHGAGDFKENYLELAAHLAKKGISSLLLDMHGHGSSGGAEYHVCMREWVADYKAALDYLETRTDVEAGCIGGFGVSSGGTAILETSLVDSRLKALVALDATVMNTLPWSLTLTMGTLSAVGYVKRFLTGKDLRISIAKLLDEVELASDPEVNARLQVDPGKIRAFQNFPLPGASEAFFVNTIRRVHKVKAATLVIWGEEDELDPVSTAHTLYNALTCTKRLEIIAGNGHAGHLDRHRQKVFDFTADWLLQHLV
jgi:alpha-beta hydrolase superfamily lysophospholipase